MDQRDFPERKMASTLSIEAKNYPILSELLHDSKSYDVYLIGNDSEEGVGAHRLILSTVSPYFKAMFSSNMKESSEKAVKVTLFSRTVLCSVVDFAYLGKVSVDVGTLVPLFAAADHFNMQRMMDACNTCFYSWKMTAYNCCQWYIDSLQWGQLTEELGARCLRFMSEHIKDVTQTSIFVNLPYKAVCHFVKNDTIVIPEIDLFQSVTHWMDENTSASESSEPLLDHVRYPYISPHDLVCIVGPCESKSLTNYLKALEFHHCPSVDKINAAQFLPRGKGCVLLPLMTPGGGWEGPHTHPSTLSIPPKPHAIPHCSTDLPIAALIARESCRFSFRCNGAFCKGSHAHDICLAVLPLANSGCSEVLKEVELPALQERAVRSFDRSMRTYHDVTAKSYSCEITRAQQSCLLMVDGCENHQIGHTLPLTITFRVTCTCLRFTVEIR
jgi:hypothetical protein